MGRRDQHDDDDFGGADWLLGQLSDAEESDAVEPDAPQTQQTPQTPQATPWWSEQVTPAAPAAPVTPAAPITPAAPVTPAMPGQSPSPFQRTAPYQPAPFTGPTPAQPAQPQPVQSQGWPGVQTPDASGTPAEPIAPASPAPTTPAPTTPASSTPASSTPAARGESLDWFSLAEASAPPISFEQPRAEPPAEESGHDRGLAPAWSAPRWNPSDSGQAPIDPILSSVEPPVTGNVEAAEAPAPPAAQPVSPAPQPTVPGPVTPPASFALTWGDEPGATPAAAAAAAPAPAAASLPPVAAPLPVAAPPVVAPQVVAPPAAEAPVVDAPVVHEPIAHAADEPLPLLQRPRAPRSWDELAEQPVASVPPVEHPAAEHHIPVEEPQRPVDPRAVALPTAASPVAARGYDEELWSALQEPEHPHTAGGGAATAAAAGAAFGAAAARPPFPSFAAGPAPTPIAEPTPPVDDLLAALGGGGRTNTAQPQHPAQPEPTFGFAEPEPAAPERSTDPYEQELYEAQSQAATPTVAIPQWSAAPVAETIDEPAEASDDFGSLGLSFDDEPIEESYPAATARYPIAAAADDEDEEPGYAWNLRPNPNATDPRADQGPIATAALTAAALEAGDVPSSGLGSLVAQKPAFASDDELPSSGLGSLVGSASAAPRGADAAYRSGGSGDFGGSSDGSGGFGGGPGGPGGSNGSGGSGSAGGSNGSGGSAGPDGKRRVLIGVVAGAAVLAVLGGLFFLGTKLPLGGGAPASAGASATAGETASAEPVAPTAAQPAGVHEWNTLFGGECIDPFADAWAEEFTVVDCAAPHAAQLVLRGSLAGGDPAAAFPGEAELTTQLAATCRADGVFDAAAIAGMTDLQVLSSYPLADQWAAGERTFYCFANRSSGEPLTGNIAGATPSQVVAAAPAPEAPAEEAPAEEAPAAG